MINVLPAYPSLPYPYTHCVMRHHPVLIHILAPDLNVFDDVLVLYHPHHPSVTLTTAKRLFNLFKRTTLGLGHAKVLPDRADRSLASQLYARGGDAET